MANTTGPDLTSKAIIGKGTSFSIGTLDTPSVFTILGEAKSCSFGNSKNDIIDVTNFDSAGRFKEYKAALADAGEITVSGNYVSSDSGQSALKAAFISGAVTPFKMVLPKVNAASTAGETWIIQGIVTENDTDVTYNTAISYSVKVQCTGPIDVTLES